MLRMRPDCNSEDQKILNDLKVSIKNTKSEYKDQVLIIKTFLKRSEDAFHKGDCLNGKKYLAYACKSSYKIDDVNYEDKINFLEYALEVLTELGDEVSKDDLERIIQLVKDQKTYIQIHDYNNIMSQKRVMEEESSVVFVGPKSSGKTTALLLLHSHSIDNKNELKIKEYKPIIRSSEFDLYTQAKDLVNFGYPPPPTEPRLKDLKVELNYIFDAEKKGLFGGKQKKVKLIFADMSGEISDSLMRVWPTLGRVPPDELTKKLKQTALSDDEIQYVIRNIMNANGIILVADASKIGIRGEDPDPKLAYYLNNLITQIENTSGKPPQGIGLLLTKFEKWEAAYPQFTSDEGLKEFVKLYLNYTNALIEAFNKEGVSYEVFYSCLYKDSESEEERFKLDLNKNRVLYVEKQYDRLLNWIKNTFATEG